MEFKEMVAEDINNVFENLDEFAETFKWNGGSGATYTITAVMDDDKLMKEYSSEFDLLPTGSHLLHVAASQFKTRPKVSDAVKLNNNLYTVNEIIDNMGMLDIFLARGKG